MFMQLLFRFEQVKASEKITVFKLEEKTYCIC